MELTMNLIVTAVTAVVTYVLGLISKKKGWNEKFPVQIQNIIIVIISTVIGSALHIQNLSLNEIIAAAASALSGVGTAVMYYDTKNQ